MVRARNVKIDMLVDYEWFLREEINIKSTEVLKGSGDLLF